MSVRYAALTCLAALIALPAMVCGEGESGQGGIRARLELRDADGQRASDFAAGESIHLRLALTNTGEVEATLPFSSGRTHDAVITVADGEERWRWSEGRSFMQMLSELRLGPGESREVDLVCHTDRVVPALGPGRYQAAGIVPLLGAEIRTDPVTFEVR